MANRIFLLYGLLLGFLGIIAVTPFGSHYVRHFLSDESQLTFYATLNEQQTDTTIVVLGSKIRSGDTLKHRLKEILSHQPKAVYIDIFFDSLESTERFDGLIILPIVQSGDDLVPYHYSVNNFTTREAHGVAIAEDIFYVPKKIDDGDDGLPSVELAIIKEYDPILFETLSNDPMPELVNYIPASNFFFHCLDDPLYGEDAELFGRMLHDKIVIVGNFDTSTPSPYDTWDVHNTPIGRMHGAFVIANGLHTLISDRVFSPSQVLVIGMAAILFAATFFAVNALKLKNEIAFIVVVNLCCVFVVFGLELASAYLMQYFRIFISQQTIATALISGTQLGTLYRLRFGQANATGPQVR
jgi:hypothetical protein